ncbi:MAG TPA: peptidylprolyl isomerase [Elusimicrobiota bacterium]|nr:peptidylprolyl isomerase [Elusimicrobiota bacterium]
MRSLRAALLLTLALAPALALAQKEPRVGDERVLLHTNAGDIVLALYPDVAPRHVAQILKLVRLGDYDSTHFLRVIPGFLVQLAEVTDRPVPLNEAQAAAIHPLKAEFSRLRHQAGVLSMSRDDKDPDSALTSFSILLGDWPEGDGRYTIFGRVQEGMDVVDEFLKVPRGDDDQPETPLEVLSAEAVTASQLAHRRLAPARPLGVSLDAQQAAARALAEERSKVLVAGIAAMALMALLSYAASLRFPRAAPTVNLIAVLVGVFLLFAALTPDAYRSRALSIAIFLGILGTFKLMSGFEGAPPASPAPGRKP